MSDSKPTNQKLARRLTDQQLIDIANYDAGGCLCGHSESCSVCSRSQSAILLEQNAKLAALEVLDLRGVPVFEEFKGTSWEERRIFSIKEKIS